MRRRFTTLFEPRAVRELDEARSWWAEHRNTPALDEAITSTLERLETLPWSAARVQIAGEWSMIRRASLGRTGYNLYYRPNEEMATITVMCIWHERRAPPRLAGARRST